MAISFVLHAVVLGTGWALLPSDAAREAPTHRVIAVAQTTPRFEPEAEPEVVPLPPLDVVSESTPDVPVMQPPQELALPDPEPRETLASLERTTIRVDTQWFQRRVPTPRATPAPMPKPSVVAPATVSVAAKPVARAARLRARAVPPLVRYYPDGLRRRGVEGRVMVKVTVSARGYVVDAEVITSSGRNAFDEAALRLVRDTRFEPPGAVAYGKLPVNFRLR